MSATPWGLPTDDLDAVAESSAADLKCWQGARLLVTGGTGFLGSWLVGSLLQANLRLALGLRIVVLSRNPNAVPLEESDQLTLVLGDVCALPELGAFDVIVHAAASSSSVFGVGDGEPRQMAATIFDGARGVIEVASRSQAKVLFLSSGAVYGPQIAPVSEEVMTSADPSDQHSTYALAKRLAESMFASAVAAGDLDAVIGRLFTFVGPRLPLDRHYAAGNFLNDALAGRNITIQGDGRPLRSYLYGGDLPQWCWALLSRGKSNHPYNVGSPEAISVADLAHRVAAIAGGPTRVEIRGAPQNGPPPCYVPITDRARSELGLHVRTDLDNALKKTLSWYKATTP